MEEETRIQEYIDTASVIPRETDNEEADTWNKLRRRHATNTVSKIDGVLQKVEQLPYGTLIVRPKYLFRRRWI